MSINPLSCWHRWLKRFRSGLRQRPRPSRWRPRLFLEVLEDRQLLSAYLVTSVADDGSAGTLRDAIAKVNAGVNNGIDFDITSGGQTINIGGSSGTYKGLALPTITANNITLNGINQATGTAVVLNGSVTGYGIADGLALGGNGDTAFGFVIENCSLGIDVSGTGNVIGSTAVGSGNVLSANDKAGLQIESTATGTSVIGNYIGVKSGGNNAWSNVIDGVVDNAANTTIGGTTAGAANLISGNTSNGIVISSSGVLVEGNFIGTNSSGSSAVGNSGNGIEVEASNVTIGGTTAQGRNVLSGNSGDGVRIDAGASGVVVQNNYIGTDKTGSKSLANSTGVEVAGNNNTIGSTVWTARNVIAGNSNDGVLLDSGASGNQILGNAIGTNAASTAALGNGNGIEVQSSGNTIGGTAAGARNVVAGNSKDGLLFDSGGSGNAVQDNFIGLNSAGNALGNGNGIEDAGGGNTIGGSAAARNYISGNSGDGILIDSGAKASLVQSNYIGTSTAGTAARPNNNGIVLNGTGNTVGGTTVAARNVISANAKDGVFITGSGNVVQGNYVGLSQTRSALGNGLYGIDISGSGSNTIGGSVSGAGNVIAYNNAAGVNVNSSNGNTLRRNSIFANGNSKSGPGIVLQNGANNNIVAPSVTTASFDSTTNVLTAAGTVTLSAAGAYIMEFFASTAGDPEGNVFVGTKTFTVAKAGTFAFSFATGLASSLMVSHPLITGTLIDSSGDTSIFSNAQTVQMTAASFDVLNYHNDAASTGQNLNETTLTPTNVNATSFGKLFSTSVDGQVYAQPLFMANVIITTGTNQGLHNVVFVATQNDSLYAIDANNGAVLWHDSLLNAVHGGTVTPVPSSDVGSGDISPEIGITATPVIDAATGTIYVEAKTKEVAGDGSHYIHQLYAISINDGSYKDGSPVVVADSIGDTYVSGPTIPGTGAGSNNGIDYFDALRQQDRPGLIEANGNIYLGFGSHGDQGNYHGWLLSYNAANLKLDGVLNVTPNGSEGAIWMSGDHIEVDSQGNLYFSTGNGTFDTTLNSAGMPINGDYGDSYVKVAVDPSSTSSNPNINGWGLKVVDYFTPNEQAYLDQNDLDLGSGGLMLLPASVGSTAHPNLLVGAGKEGRIYLIDCNNMGHYDPNTDHVVEETALGVIGGSWDSPVYYNGTIYYGGANDVGKTFSIANGQMSLTPTSQSNDSFAYPGASPSISANGSTNGLVWAVDISSQQLRAYNANGFNQELYTSADAANNRDALTGNPIKFAVPTVADGEVFVGTSDAINVYGELT